MSESTRVLNGGGGVASGHHDNNIIVDGWKRVAHINMKAMEQSATSGGDKAQADSYDEVSALPSVGYDADNASNKTKEGDVIVLDDDSPQQEEGVDPSAADFNALKELLDQEEKKLKQLKSQRVRQTSPINNATSATRAGTGPTIQGSALNKTTGRAVNSVGPLRESAAIPIKSTSQSKPSIVVVPGKPATSRSGGTTAASTVTVPSKTSSSSAAHSTGISSRLQQIVDTVAVDQALGSISSSSSAHSALRSLNPSAQARLLSSIQTPPVPSLITTSNSSQKLSNGSYHTSNMPPLRPKLPIGNRSSHEIITIGDSPVTKNPPPPLLSTASSGLTGLSSSGVRVPTATGTGSIHVPAISSVSRALSAISNATHGQIDTMEAVENSKRYREFRMKQLHNRKTFQKQIERRMVSSPYPKTFRQVWPVIPIQDPAFIRNFGLEAVLHHFDSGLKALHEKSSNTSKVKPICNQCGCDFASAWQIRKNNSKQLLLCEACDFQNLKILQRTKLSNQLKDLMESVEKEEEKFAKQNEDALKQVVALEKQSILASRGSKAPPPLTSSIQGKIPDRLSANHSVIQVSDMVGARQSGLGAIVGGGGRSSSHVTSVGKVQMSSGLASGGAIARAVIPSIIGQMSHQSHMSGGAESGRKRKDPPPSSDNSAPPTSKSLKVGSILDLTLNKLSQQLIHRKLDEQRQELVADSRSEEAESRRDASPSPVPGGVATPTTKVITESRKSRRKGTPRHKRHLSSSSVTSE